MDWRSTKSFILYWCSRHRLKLVAAVGALVVGGSIWAASAPAYYSPTHYIIKSKATGLCTVVRERPTDRRKYTIVWFTTLKRVAIKKAREFKKSGRCRRVPLPRSRQRRS